MNTDNMQHGYTWQGQDVSGWIATEKFDGIRAYWDGETLWTRGGKAVPIQQEWREALPHGIHLDGEIFAGYGQRKRAEWFARAGKYAEECVYKAFDSPNAPGGYVWRLGTIKENAIVNNISGMRLASNDDARRFLDYVLTHGGEGLILRHPEIVYAPGRTDRLLKLKTWEI